ncbi:MAG: glycosyltransferase family 2 protein [Candidatus Omnitrophota bacterium]|jgi:glycosyltransferase involved in cell wall biosynthesis
MKLTVVVTVFNERETILKAIEQVKGLNLEKQIIVVDNCSTDGTREILRSLHDPALEIVYQSTNCGYGRSVSLGVELACGEYVYVHNSDLEYDPVCVYEMLNLAEKEGFDAIFGSRLLNRKNESKLKILQERPFYLGTIITTFLANLLYGKNFTDIIGTRFYRAEAFKKIKPKISTIGFDFEVVSKLCKGGFKIKELPVNYKPRTMGKKKVKVYDIIPAVLTMLKVKFCPAE